jgi:hypothetical protein
MVPKDVTAWTSTWAPWTPNWGSNYCRAYELSVGSDIKFASEHELCCMLSDDQHLQSLRFSRLVAVSLLFPLRFPYQMEWSLKALISTVTLNLNCNNLWPLSGFISDMILWYVALWFEEVIVWCTLVPNRLINKLISDVWRKAWQPGFPET